MPRIKIKAVPAAAAISLGQRAAAAAMDGRACRHGPRHSKVYAYWHNSCGVSNDKARVCGITKGRSGIQLVHVQFYMAFGNYTIRYEMLF